jgi:hypothetical protein
MAQKRTLTGTDLARQIWSRYTFLRDNGHADYVKKAEKCEGFFAGQQWEAGDLAYLKSVKRPALTINKIISTISNVMGAQIFNRTDTAFKPRNEGATAEVADALTKVYMQIGDNNQLTWVRSDVFADGIITSRGFYDIRLDFTDSLRGEVRITQRNCKNVLIDNDADSYDPDGWSDVIYTEWQSLDDIELMYGAAVADKLDKASSTIVDGAADDVYLNRDRFGLSIPYGQSDSSEVAARHNRRIRVLDYQWKRLDKLTHFVDVQTGDMRPVPDSWDRPRVDEYLRMNPDQAITTKLVKRIRWTVVAGDEVLHDDWSPYKHFTIVPYFPHFRRGKTVGIVENLLGPQELLNKVSSQELHVVNTTANSGYKVKRNALQNMSAGELEQRGAQSGIVIELDDLNNLEKITPNPTPTGLDRISYKAEEHVKSISGVSDYMTGFAREDVSAKSVKANQAGGSSNLAKVQDNLNRTDYLMARNILDIVQEYYTEPRLVRITTDKMTNRTDTVQVNQTTPEGQVINDLTLGEYAVVITNQPDRDTFEETQFDQALRLRTEAGVQLPDKYLIQSSRLKDKAEIVQSMEGDQNSPEAQKQKELAARKAEAEVAGLEADVGLKQAQAQKALAQAQEAGQPAGTDASLPQELSLEAQKLQADIQQAEKELAMKKYEIDVTLAQKQRELDVKIQLERDKHAAEARQSQLDRENEVKTARLDAVRQALSPPPEENKT